MKVAVTGGNGTLSIENVSIPQPGHYECLCKISACATCTGTDKKHIAGKMPWNQKYPGILGHESVGKVVEIGSKVRNIRKGETYLRPTAVYQGSQLNGYYSCWGGFAEYGLITDTKALLEDNLNAEPNPYTRFQQKIPDDISVLSSDATMLITLKETASYVSNVGVRMNTPVIILGAGTVGMSMCFFSKLYGAYPVIVISRSEESLKRAEECGADCVISSETGDIDARVKEIVPGNKVDFIIDAAGNTDLVGRASTCLAENGRISLYALGSSMDEIIHQNDKLTKEHFVSFGSGEDIVHPYLLSLLRLKAVNLRTFYSHRMPLTEIEAGFEMLRNKQAFKIVFEMA